ncbi:MAG: triose-phosphate isomerase [Alphaproteobacteria bacterium]|nr:triose-phosphate isomerase [Alphaproteobacteria bacterium]
MAASGAPRPLVVANWKMNGLRRDGIDRARALVLLARNKGQIAGEVVLCPPATLLHEIRAALSGSGIGLGAQDCHAAASGAHTGDLSAPMLADLGCAYVIVGHSERRAGHGESDLQVRAKAEAALAVGLGPIICVGESEAARDQGQSVAVVRAQLEGSVPSGVAGEALAIAYEPIWAIGTGRTPKPEQIAEVHAMIHEFGKARFSGGAAALRVLYGGSVNARNAAEILSLEGVNGALVGGASLEAAGFWTICEAAGGPVMAAQGR